jgi:hypothetical protein
LPRTKHNSIENAGGPAKRQAILDALTRATAIKSPSGGTPREFDDEINGYYTLTLEEMAALVNGDMQKIESWVSTLDQRHATWLLRWLIRERQ